MSEPSTGRLRLYNDLKAPDRSGILAQVQALHKRVEARLSQVRRTVAVMSGKGGVGKSFVTAHLATELATQGHRVGVLDADLNSPTIPRLLELEHSPGKLTDEGLEPGQTSQGVRVMSIGYMLGRRQPLQWKEPAGDAFVWRGTLEAGALRELLSDVVWGELDLLLVDLPPGAPRLVDLHELVPNLTGILAVTIPSDESLDSVYRALTVARDRGVPILALVENMAGFACPACGHCESLFPGEAGKSLATAFKLDAPVTLPFGPASVDQSRMALALEKKLGLS